MKPHSTRPLISEGKKLPGFCLQCGALATVQALFQIQDAVVLERYCANCIGQANYLEEPAAGFSL